MKNKLHTVLVQTLDSVHRVDLTINRADGTMEVIGTPFHQQQDSTLLADAVALTSCQPSCRGTIWLLTTEAWTGTVTLEPDVARRLDTQQLVMALATEAEYESGFTSSDCATAIERSDATSAEWLVTQLPFDLLDSATAHARLNGCHVSRIAALPDPLNEELPRSAGNVIEAAVIDFLSGQLGSTPSVPTLKIENHSRNRWIAGTCYAASAALLLLASLYTQTQLTNRLATVSQHIESARQSIKLLDDDQLKLAQTLKSERAVLASRASTAQRHAQLVAIGRQQDIIERDRQVAIAQLLEAMAVSATEHLWVSHVDCRQETKQLAAHIEGQATSPLEVARFAQRMQVALQSSNPRWKVFVTSILGERSTANFELNVQLRPLKGSGGASA